VGTSTIRYVAALAAVAALGLGACGGDSHKTVSAASSGRPGATTFIAHEQR
jgi:predicted outer membrane protein